MGVNRISTVTSLQIRLGESCQPEGQSSYSSATCLHYALKTSVRLLDAHTVVCCSGRTRKIYLIRFDLGYCQYTMVDSEDAIWRGRSSKMALCDIDGRGHIITSNGEDGNMSLYCVAEDKIWLD